MIAVVAACDFDLIVKVNWTANFGFITQHRNLKIQGNGELKIACYG